MSNSQEQLRVAIIGASGIGKNHAAWFAKHGATICGFAGTSESSIARTQQALAERLGYAPPGFVDVQRLMEELKPDAVCVASPPARHFEHVQMALARNIPVLCEKPLVYDPKLSNEVLIRQANQLVSEAREKQILLGTQTQYSLVAEQFCELAETTPQNVASFDMVMETKNLKPGRSHETIWIELAPHPLSVLQRVAGDAELDMDSIRCDIADQETSAQFELVRNNGSKIRASLVTRCDPGKSTPLRRFILDGHTLEYAGRKNENGDFVTYLSSAKEQIEMPDLVDLLIGNFVAACRGEAQLAVTGEDGARNVEWMLKILERGVRA